MFAQRGSGRFDITALDRPVNALMLGLHMPKIDSTLFRGFSRHTDGLARNDDGSKEMEESFEVSDSQ